MSAPLVREVSQDVPAVSTAGNDEDTVIGVVPFDGVITAVGYVPESTITGAATNNRTVSVVNKGQDGSGTATAATLSFGAGTNAAGLDEKAVPLSGTADNLKVTAGDTLLWRSTHVGTGITDPGGFVRVTLSRS